MTETFDLAQGVSRSHSTLRSEAGPLVPSSGFTQMRLGSPRGFPHPRLSSESPSFPVLVGIHACGPLPGFLGPAAAPCGFAFARSWVAKAFCSFTAHFVSLKNNVSSENSQRLFPLASLRFTTLRKSASNKYCRVTEISALTSYVNFQQTWFTFFFFLRFNTNMAVEPWKLNPHCVY